MENKYVEIHMPNHHRAKKNGMVYEHVLVAEEMLGRDLREKEEVHHEDRNRSNNNPDNLYVFATKEDHVRYHHNGIMIEVDDYYIATDNKESALCEICKNEFSYYENKQTGKFCSKKCYGESMKKSVRPSKEELLQLIKSKPFTTIAEDYGVSDNAIRKWCKSYGLPYKLKDIKLLKQ